MKTVRLDSGAVAEIIPPYATPVEKWYGAAFAALCTEAPDEVEPGWTRNADGAWSAPAEPEPVPAEPEEPTTEADILETVLDHEARLAALELGGGEG